MKHKKSNQLTNGIHTAHKKQIKEIEGKRNEMKLEHKLSSKFRFSTTVFFPFHLVIDEERPRQFVHTVNLNLRFNKHNYSN